jgi:hypothetical protein
MVYTLPQSTWSERQSKSKMFFLETAQQNPNVDEPMASLATSMGLMEPLVVMTALADIRGTIVLISLCRR